jgi:hypothetical protein
MLHGIIGVGDRYAHVHIEKSSRIIMHRECKKTIHSDRHAAPTFVALLLLV